jgi:hypothetical protein
MEVSKNGQAWECGLHNETGVLCYNLALPPAFSFIFNCFDFKELWDPQAYEMHDSLVTPVWGLIHVDQYETLFSNYYIWALSRVYVWISVLARIDQYWQNSWRHV